MSNPKAKWEKFFHACSLPNTVCTNYATKFVKERIQPYMLKELQKEDLEHLGIAAYGDQKAILKHIRENVSSASAEKTKMDYDDVEEDESMETADVKPSNAPDRHDVYKIHMPEGKTEKTRTILEKQEELRKKGLLKRGTTGTRISGVDIISSKPKSLSSRIAESSKVIKKPVMSADVSSTTKLIHSKMRSDQIIAKKAIQVGAGGGNMLRQALVNTIHDTDNTNFRVRLNVPSTSRKTVYVQEVPPPAPKPKVVYVQEAPPPTRRPKPYVVQKPITQRLQLVQPVATNIYDRVSTARKPISARVMARPKNIADRLSIV